jgi:hypothetical protein
VGKPDDGAPPKAEVVTMDKAANEAANIEEQVNFFIFFLFEFV